MRRQTDGGCRAFSSQQEHGASDMGDEEMMKMLLVQPVFKSEIKSKHEDNALQTGFNLFKSLYGQKYADTTLVILISCRPFSSSEI